MLDWISHLAVFSIGAASFSIIGALTWADCGGTSEFVDIQVAAFVIWTYIFLIGEVLAFSGWYLL